MTRPVRTTQTHTDLLEKKKKLDSEIVFVKGINEDLAKTSNALSEELDNKFKQIELCEKRFDELLNSFDSIESLYQEFHNLYESLATQSLFLSDASFKLLGTIKQKIEEENLKFDKIKIKQIDSENELKRKHEELSRKQKDIDIYRSRLQKYIEESGSNIKLIF